MGKGNQRGNGYFCPKCNTECKSLSAMQSCCEKNFKKCSWTKKSGIAWGSSGAGGSGSTTESDPKETRTDQKATGADQKETGRSEGDGGRSEGDGGRSGSAVKEGEGEGSGKVSNT